MNKTWLLVKVLFKESSSMLSGGLGSSSGRRGRKRNSGKGSLAASVLIAAILVVVTGVFGFFVHAVMPFAGRQLLVILLFAAGAFSFFMTIPSVLGSFYASSDIEDLLPMPLSSGTIVTAKSLVALASSYAIPAAILVGPMVGWGIAAGSGVAYWVATVLIVIFAPMLPFAYAGILSVLLAAVSKKLRRREVVTTIATVITLAVSLASVFGGQFLSNTHDMQAIAGMAGAFETITWVFPAYPFAAEAVATSSFAGIGIFIAISLAALVVFFAFAHLVYLRTVTSLTAGGKERKAYGGEAQKAGRSVFSAIAVCDSKKTLRTSQILLYQIVYPLILLLIIVFVSFGGSYHEGMRTMLASEMGATLQVVPCMIALFIGGIVTSINRIASIAISREGSNWSYMKAIPVPYERLVRAKIAGGVTVNCIMMIVAMLFIFVPLVAHGVGIVEVASSIVLGLAMVWLGSCFSVSADAARPKVDWGNDGDFENKSVSGGAGYLRYLIVVIVFSALPAITFLGIPTQAALPVAAAVGVVLALFLGRLLLRKAAGNLAAFEG